MILTVARLKNNYTQEEIGNKIGWSRSKVAQYIRLLNEIVTQVLDIARKHQKGRVTKDVTHVTFNFTEGWFRTVGIEVK
jgi:transcriptional regulator with XRE-family HTH domain